MDDLYERILAEVEHAMRIGRTNTSVTVYTSSLAARRKHLIPLFQTASEQLTNMGFKATTTAVEEKHRFGMKLEIAW
jgi:hypothetical protein